MQLTTSTPVRTLWRVGALLLGLAVVACQESALVSPPQDANPATLAVQRDAPIVLRGTIITPAGVLKHGYVAVANGRILSVSEKQPVINVAILVESVVLIVC
ncbi:MAG: hypothetical protein ACJ79A_03890, partial [Gemmatimonadaceae bacterium]